MDKEVKMPFLNKLNIFSYVDDNVSLLYAPLSGFVAQATAEEMLQLEAEAAAGHSSDTLDMLCDSDVVVLHTALPSTITELTILLNQICNFSCFYCYSSKGREKAVLSREKLHILLHEFITKERGNRLSLVFSGGGDPVLSFDIFRDAVLYAEDRAAAQGIQVDVSIVTNGSTLTDEYVRFIREHQIGLVVSFDILEEVHNKQRSHYDVVASTIDYLCDNDIPFGLRATITPLNVCRQEEMVEELHRRFPKVKSAAFEAVLNKNLFDSVAQLNDFYLDFQTHLFRAMALGRSFGIMIGNTVVDNVNCCKQRACLGKLVATPFGKLTACSRLSSDKEEHFQNFVYGSIAEDHLAVDNEKYHQIMQHNNEVAGCSSCIAKWHCSGGCLLARYTLPDNYMEAYCQFMRRMTVNVLMEQINEE